MSDAEPSTSRGLAAIFAALPALAVAGGLALLHAATADGLARGLLRDSGSWGWLVLGPAPAGVIVCGVLAYAALRGRPVPAAVLSLLVAAPWWVALLGVFDGSLAVLHATSRADPSSVAAMLARGIAELAATRALGTAVAAAAALGTAVALSPRARGSAEARAVVAALALLGALAAGACATSVSSAALFRPLSSMAPVERAAHAALALAALERTTAIAWVGPALALLVAIALAVQVVRARPRPAVVASGIALALVVGASVAMDALVARLVESRIEESLPAPIALDPDFQPITPPAWMTSSDDPPTWVVSTEAFEGPPRITTAELATEAGRGRLAAAIRDEQAREDALARAREAALDSDYLPEAWVDEYEHVRVHGGRLRLAVDARVPTATLAAIVRAAADADIGVLVLAGLGPDGPIHGRGRLLEVLTTRVVDAELEIASQIPEGVAAVDTRFAHGEIGASPSLRDGSTLPFGPDARAPERASAYGADGQIRRAWLTLAAQGAAEDVYLAALSLAWSGLEPTLAVDGLPPH